ncbi:hypothetical protein BH09VER1_BH09VER1_17730 [soil metagenome]
MESTALEEVATTAVAPSDQYHLDHAHEFGAELIVPTQEQAPPLSKEELEPKSGGPVVARGVNFTAMGRRYLDCVHGANTGEEPLPNLSQLSALAQTSRFQRDMKTLMDHDSKAHRAAGHTKFEEYFLECTGEAASHSTLFRRMVEMRFALILSANGAIDFLPSQAQCYRISQVIPRHHWVAFVRLTYAGKPPGKTALEIALSRYVEVNSLFVVGERVVEKLNAVEDRPPLSTKSDLANEETPSQQTLPEKPASTRKEKDRALLLELGVWLKDYFPESVHSREAKEPIPLQRRCLTAMREEIRVRPDPAKAPKRRRLIDEIRAVHPDLGQQIEACMVSLFFEHVEKRLFQKKPAKKNVPRPERFAMIKGPGLY